jgi:hypothetical protein
MAIVDLKMAPAHSGASKDEILKLLDQEVERFSTFMANLEDFRARGALNNPEKALIKTYLVQKLNGKLDGVA